MKRTLLSACVLVALSGTTYGQETATGLDLRATLSGEVAGSPLLSADPRNGSSTVAGFRSVFYPVLNLSEHWGATGAFQLYSRPFYYDSFKNAGNGVNGTLLQGSLNYSRVSSQGLLLVRAGQLSTAFGSFPLRYDDAENPVVDLPVEYGYYGPVSLRGLLATEVDASRGKWDGRVQFSNSSPANPRSITASDQYANWSGGGGFSPRQGLRIGASAYRGPYLDRHGEHYLPGEIAISKLPAHAYGIDGTWTHGHLTVQGEWQHFTMPYTITPVVNEKAAYTEAKFTVNPRWYGAVRGGYVNGTDDGMVISMEGAAGYRPNRFQLLKLDCEIRRTSIDTETPDLSASTLDPAVTLQLVTSWHALSFSRPWRSSSKGQR